MGCLKSCTTGIAKIILFLFNFVLLVAAIVLIALVASGKNNLAGFDLSSISTVAIVIGVLIALIAFFGCCGACRESSCLLTTYAAILLTFFIIQLVLGILALISINKGDNSLETQVTDYLTEKYNEYKTSNNSKDIIDAFQTNFECCGLDGPTGAEVVISGSQLIESCCSANVTSCTNAYAFSKGCAQILTDNFEVLTRAAGGIVIGFGVVELVGAIFAFLVRSRIKRRIE